MLKNLWCQRDDLHIDGAQLTCHGAEDTAASQFAGVVKQHAGIVVEADIRAVSTTNFLFCADNQGLRYCTFFNITCWDGVFDSDDYHVTHAGIATACAAEHSDAKSLASAAIVGYYKSCFCLYHNYFAFSTICTNLQRFVLDRGRVSMMSTVSPTWHSLFSS